MTNLLKLVKYLISKPLQRPCQVPSVLAILLVVAVAVSLGGPGATFWMIVIGLLGMSTKFAEATLGVEYRHINPDGTISGGPMYYLTKGFAERGLEGVGKILAKNGDR